MNLRSATISYESRQHKVFHFVNSRMKWWKKMNPALKGATRALAKKNTTVETVQARKITIISLELCKRINLFSTGKRRPSSRVCTGETQIKYSSLCYMRPSYHNNIQIGIHILTRISAFRVEIDSRARHKLPYENRPISSHKQTSPI